MAIVRKIIRQMAIKNNISKASTHHYPKVHISTHSMVNIHFIPLDRASHVTSSQ